MRHKLEEDDRIEVTCEPDKRSMMFHIQRKATELSITFGIQHYSLLPQYSFYQAKTSVLVLFLHLAE